MVYPDIWDTLLLNSCCGKPCIISVVFRLSEIHSLACLLAFPLWNLFFMIKSCIQQTEDVYHSLTCGEAICPNPPSLKMSGWLDMQEVTGASAWDGKWEWKAMNLQHSFQPVKGGKEQKVLDCSAVQWHLMRLVWDLQASISSQNSTASPRRAPALGPSPHSATS